MKWGRIKWNGGERTVHIDGTMACLHEGELPDPGPETGETVPLSDVSWRPPVIPRQFLGLWNNFHERREAEKLFMPKFPLYFVKLWNSVAAAGDPITRPPGFDGKIKYEAELGVVIGKETFQVSPDEVDAHVFGYTCVNDVTAPEPLWEEDGFTNWCRSKSFPGFGPIGPVIETDCEPDALRVKSKLDGEQQQNYPVADMIFKPRQIVSLISQEVRLLPGDVIACGTSTGAGLMQPGQTIEVEIPGVGSLRNTYAG